MSATAKMPARPKTPPDPAPHLAAALAMGGRATVAERALLYVWGTTSPAGPPPARPTIRDVAAHLGVGVDAALAAVVALEDDGLWPAPPPYKSTGQGGPGERGPGKLAERESRAVGMVRWRGR